MADTSIGKNDIATIMYHCGVSVDMNYEVNESSGRGFNGV